MRYSGDNDNFLNKEPIDYKMAYMSAISLVVIFLLTIPVLFNLWGVMLLGMDCRSTVTVAILCALTSLDYIMVLAFLNELRFSGIIFIPVTLLMAFSVWWYGDDVIWLPLSFVGITGYWLFQLFQEKLKFFSEKQMSSESKGLKIGLGFAFATLFVLFVTLIVIFCMSLFPNNCCSGLFK